MGKQEKLIARLGKVPADFTWQELTTLLKGLGYQECRAGQPAIGRGVVAGCPALRN